MLNERREKIITLLKSSRGWMKGKEMSELLNVSDRTIRSDIANINLYYDNIMIESDIRNGYHLNEEASLSLNLHKENIIPQTSFQRCFYIIYELLFKKNELNLIYLMNKLYISDSSLENDIKEIKKMLELYHGLKLKRCKYYISLDGSEEKKRELYTKLLIKKASKNCFNMDCLAAFFPDLDFYNIKELLEKILKKYNYTIREMEFPVVMTYIGVAINRMLYNNYIKTESLNEKIINSTELTIAKEFYKSISENLHTMINKNENDFLALLLYEKEGINTDSKTLLSDNNLNVNQLVNEILEKLFIQFDIDLRDDKDLIDGLSNHIMQLLERKKKNVNISNLYLAELKYKYPFFFEMAVQVGKGIEDSLNISVDETDISFIEQHLGAALERLNYKNKYKIILINPNNQALSSFCTKKIENIFHERMLIIKSMNYFEQNEIMNIKPDLILTTIPIEHNLNILTVQISIFINSDDEINIFKALNLLDSNKFRKEHIISFKNMIDERFFYPEIDMDSPEKILKFMCDELYNADFVDKDFKGSVLKREKLSPTSFIYSFALPHPIKAMSKESKIPVVLLKRPVQWGEFKVKLVLLLAIQENHEKIMRTFFDRFGDIVNDSKKLTCLMKSKNYNEFISQIIC